MKKTIYGVFSETRQRGSEEPWDDETLMYCTDTIEEAKEDCERFNEEQEISNKFLQTYYYIKEVSLYTKH